MATREEGVVLWTLLGGVGAVLMALPVWLGFRMPIALLEIGAGGALLALAYFRLRPVPRKRKRTGESKKTEP